MMTGNLGHLVRFRPPAGRAEFQFQRSATAAAQAPVGDRGATRTRDLLFRKQLLYPAELRSLHPAYITPMAPVQAQAWARPDVLTKLQHASSALELV